MRKKHIPPLLGKLLRKIAPKGVVVTLEPRWGVVGQIRYRNGRKRYFRHSSIDLNPLGASDVAKDKDYANFFMKRMGYPVIPGSKTFYSKDWGEKIGETHRGVLAALRHAQKLGFPVVVKPNDGSKGQHVALVHTKAEFNQALHTIFDHHSIALVQKYVAGSDFRIVVLDNEVISAYGRTPLSVVGDGRSTIRTLLVGKQEQFRREGRDTMIQLRDLRIARKLKHAGLSFTSVPPKGGRIFLLDNANLSTGGESLDVTAKVHPAFKRLAIKLTKDMGLRFCGVDLMVAGDITKKPKRWWVIEINAAPGLDHYVKTGKVQQRIVEKMYLKVLKSMERTV